MKLYNVLPGTAHWEHPAVIVFLCMRHDCALRELLMLRSQVSLMIDTYVVCYNKRRASGINILKAYWRRLRDVCKADGLWLVEYELFPFMPYFIEKIFLRKNKYILNFDDNVWEKYNGKILLTGKYDKLCRNAAGIIVANDFLYDKVSKLNSNVIKIPTVVDLESLQLRQTQI